MKRYVVYHDDMDGRAAAACTLVHRCKEPLTTFIPFEWAMDQEAFTADLLARVGSGNLVFILDCHLPPDCVRTLLSRFCEVVWIDHHESAMHVYDEIEKTPLFRRRFATSIAACESAWRFCTTGGVSGPKAIALINERDLKGPGASARANLFHLALLAEDTSPESSLWDMLLWGMDTGAAVEEYIDKGEAIFYYENAQNLRRAESFAFPTSLDGHTVVAMNHSLAGSEALDSRKDSAQILCLFAFNGRVWRISLYSDTVDVGAIAKGLGGGGHRGAAGFTARVLPAWLEKSA